jgi:hypothetical protein
MLGIKLLKSSISSLSIISNWEFGIRNVELGIPHSEFRIIGAI